jgi:hypothetical protein
MHVTSFRRIANGQILNGREKEVFSRTVLGENNRTQNNPLHRTLDPDVGCLIQTSAPSQQ